MYEATGLGEVFNDSNVHLSVKSSPDKTNSSLSLIAEKQGGLYKLNDTGKKRHVAAGNLPNDALNFAKPTALTFV